MSENRAKLEGILMILNGSRYLQDKLILQDTGILPDNLKEIEFSGRCVYLGEIFVWVALDGERQGREIDARWGDADRLWREYRRVVEHQIALQRAALRGEGNRRNK